MVLLNKARQGNKAMENKVLYSLPHKFTIEAQDDGFSLYCNGKWVYWNASLDAVFVVYGKQLQYGRG